MRFPITLYKVDPIQTQFAEYCEVAYALDSKAGGFMLLERHGWWENDKKKSHFSCSVLEEHIKSEGQASTAMDQRVKHLFGTGWVYKFTTEFNPDTAWRSP